jgi:hypothetical protein
MSASSSITRRRFIGATAALAAAPCVPRNASAASSYAQSVLAKGPVGFWRLAERTGTTASDASSGGRAGSYRGNPTLGEPGALAHDSATAVRLAGRGEYIEIPNDEAFSQPASGRGMTVEVWMRPDALTFAGQTSQKYVHWLGKGDAGAFEWGFRFYSNDSPSRPNRISAYIWNPSGGEGAGAYFQDELEVGRWIHVVACYDPGDRSDPAAGVSIYRDGVLRAGPRRSRAARYASYDIMPAHRAAPLRLGTRDLASFFTGALDDAAIYPRVLSAAEIADDYRAGAV